MPRRFAAGARASTAGATTCARWATADAHFERTWDFYLACCEGGFRSLALRDAQLVLAR